MWFYSSKYLVSFGFHTYSKLKSACVLVKQLDNICTELKLKENRREIFSQSTTVLPWWVEAGIAPKTFFFRNLENILTKITAARTSPGQLFINNNDTNLNIYLLIFLILSLNKLYMSIEESYVSKCFNYPVRLLRHTHKCWHFH